MTQKDAPLAQPYIVTQSSTNKNSLFIILGPGFVVEVELPEHEAIFWCSQLNTAYTAALQKLGSALKKFSPDIVQDLIERHTQSTGNDLLRFLNGAS